MKILIVQLARLGDIYLTWPSVRAIKREYPEAEIHMLVRPRFASACTGLVALNQVKVLPNEDIFNPIFNLEISDQIAMEQCISEVNIFLTQMRIEEYDRIINLSFSPVSSFITDLIAGENTKLSGYSRFQDGFLSIEDDASAYFYGQVGINKHNRFHMADLFSEVCNVVLTDSDWDDSSIHMSCPPLIESLLNRSEYIVVHIGASNLEKSLSKEKWVLVLNRLTRQQSRRIFLVGSSEEVEISKYIQLHCKSDLISSLVGHTKVEDLFPIIKGARLLIGGDSGPIHIAALVSTPVFNLSNGRVNFWETGPKSKDSRIFLTEDFEGVGSDRIVLEILNALNGDIPGEDIVSIDEKTRAYQYFGEAEVSFEWKLIRALYMGDDFPVPRDLNFVEACRQLQELNSLSLQQFHAILTKEVHQENREMLTNIDQFVDKLVELVPDIVPVVSWYQTEKLRVGPAKKEDIISVYTNIHENLAKILSIYLGDEISEDSSTKTGELNASK